MREQNVAADERLVRLKAELAPELEVIRRIGEGSVAEVYLAREPALKRMVAVKVLRHDVATDETSRLRFEREAQAAASIHHPNITSIYRVGRLPSGIPYIIMEYVDGRTLADLLEARGPLALDEVRRILASIASALAAAHRKNIVHRDVRPGNAILEEETRRVVLMDFGIAALIDTGTQDAKRLTTIGRPLGDPLHMSPEQLRGEAVTQQSDVYGIGVLAYELLTGVGPFGKRIGSQLTQEPPALHDLQPHLDVEFSALMKRCLAKNPEHRPRANEVFESLMRAPGPGASTAVPIALTEPAGGLNGFFRELGRRKVYRVGAAYLAAAFAILQFSDSILNGLPLDVEEWYDRIVLTTLAGFPIALILSWLFDITPTGIRRSRSSDGAAQSRALLPLIGLGVSIAAAFIVWWLLLR
ncbi:MAG: serine/threonine-protein kinase [Gemmatimonadota bacterium]